MCSLLGSILHTAAQLEKHPFTPPQPPKLNKENGSVKVRSQPTMKRIICGKCVWQKKSQQSQSSPSYFPDEKWPVTERRNKKLKPIRCFGLKNLLNKYSMSLTVNDCNEVKVAKADRTGLHQAADEAFVSTVHTEMLQAESRGHRSVSDCSQ